MARINRFAIRNSDEQREPHTNSPGQQFFCCHLSHVFINVNDDDANASQDAGIT